MPEPEFGILSITVLILHQLTTFRLLTARLFCLWMDSEISAVPLGELEKVLSFECMTKCFFLIRWEFSIKL